MCAAARQRLPARRPAQTFDLEVGGLHYVATVGFYPATGKIGEIFLDGLKAGSGADLAAKDAAISASVAIQMGADPQTIRRAVCRDASGKAAGPLGAALDLLASEGAL
jgi:ribonucleoside-diphosphate reductase alpha chain